MIDAARDKVKMVETDELGHGTAVAYQVIKTCPTAKLLFFRVVQADGSVDKDAVARAILEAADPNGPVRADIINMSFGWLHDDHAGVRSALAFAKSQGLLMFAGTSNYGSLEETSILFPARADEVISVDAADGLGNHQAFNPPNTGEEHVGLRLMAPGIGMPSPTYKGSLPLSGTSFASPIAAGVAALILEFARQPPLDVSPSVAECLRSRRGMRRILHAMSKRKGTEPFLFLRPWKIFIDNFDKGGGDGSPGTPRYFAAYHIVRILREEFGDDIGREVFPYGTAADASSTIEPPTPSEPATPLEPLTPMEPARNES
jgi:hypothetical protein